MADDDEDVVRFEDIEPQVAVGDHYETKVDFSASNQAKKRKRFLYRSKNINLEELNADSQELRDVRPVVELNFDLTGYDQQNKPPHFNQAVDPLILPNSSSSNETLRANITQNLVPKSYNSRVHKAATTDILVDRPSHWGKPNNAKSQHTRNSEKQKLKLNQRRSSMDLPRHIASVLSSTTLSSREPTAILPSSLQDLSFKPSWLVSNQCAFFDKTSMGLDEIDDIAETVDTDRAIDFSPAGVHLSSRNAHAIDSIDSFSLHMKSPLGSGSGGKYTRYGKGRASAGKVMGPVRSKFNKICRNVDSNKCRMLTSSITAADGPPFKDPLDPRNSARIIADLKAISSPTLHGPYKVMLMQMQQVEMRQRHSPRKPESSVDAIPPPLSDVENGSAQARGDVMDDNAAPFTASSSVLPVMGDNMSSSSEQLHSLPSLGSVIVSLFHADVSSTGFGKEGGRRQLDKGAVIRMYDPVCLSCLWPHDDDPRSDAACPLDTSLRILVNQLWRRDIDESGGVGGGNVVPEAFTIVVCCDIWESV